MGVKTYDPAKVELVVAGVPISGFASGTFISMARAADAWSKVVGASGEVIRSKSNDRSGTLTLTLLQSSLSNDALSELASLDELSNDGVGPLMIKDLSGRLLLQAESCWVQKVADVNRGSEQENMEWMIAYDADTGLRGGH
jgi:hypothetical protein